MKRLITYLTLTLILLAASSGRAPVEKLDPVDLDFVKAQILDPSSPYFYPSLMQRFEQNETIMTALDYRMLYLGTMFQEDYNPYRRSIYTDMVEPLTFKTRHTRAELDTMIKYTSLALADTPFDLSQMNFLIYALREKGKVNLANIWQYRMNRLLESIVSSGVPTDTANAWFVIYPRDEAAIINFSSKKVQSIKPTFVEPYYDHIEIVDDQDHHQDFYFNIKTVLEEFNRKYPQ